jgi:hypothetical protein
VTFDAKRAVVRDTKGRIVCIFMRKCNLYIGRMKVKNLSHPSFGGAREVGREHTANPVRPPTPSKQDKQWFIKAVFALLDNRSTP